MNAQIPEAVADRIVADWMANRKITKGLQFTMGPLEIDVLRGFILERLLEANRDAQSASIGWDEDVTTLGRLLGLPLAGDRLWGNRVVAAFQVERNRAAKHREDAERLRTELHSVQVERNAAVELLRMLDEEYRKVSADTFPAIDEFLAKINANNEPE